MRVHTQFSTNEYKFKCICFFLIFYRKYFTSGSLKKSLITAWQDKKIRIQHSDSDDIPTNPTTHPHPPPPSPTTPRPPPPPYNPTPLSISAIPHFLQSVSTLSS